MFAGYFASGQVAQLVEHWTENPGVGGSIPSLTTKPGPLGPGFCFVGANPPIPAKDPDSPVAVAVETPLEDIAFPAPEGYCFS